MHDLKMTDQVARRENARHENVRPEIVGPENARHGVVMKRLSPADSRQGVDDQSNLSKYQNFATQWSLLYISD